MGFGTDYMSLGHTLIPVDRIIDVDPVSPDNETAKWLADSLAVVGLIHPVVIDPSNKLIAGRHRLAAARLLGWDKIAVTVRHVEGLTAELATLDENLIRADRPALEVGKMLRRRKEIYEALHPDVKQGGDQSKRNSSSVRSFAADTADKAGITDRQVRKYVEVATNLTPEAQAVIAATPLADNLAELKTLSDLEPAEQLVVAKQMAAGSKSVRHAQRTLGVKAAVKKAKKYRPPEGRYAVLVADPPWRYDDELNGAMNRGLPYPTMSTEEICAMPIGERAAADSILWLWTTNSHLLSGEALQVAKAWGFEPRAMLTWVKSNLGLGRWLRNVTEHCILAVRGKPAVELKAQPNVLHQKGKRLAHSVKPQEFFDLVEKLCPSKSRLELFARAPREGWVTSGAELPAAAPAKSDDFLVQQSAGKFYLTHAGAAALAPTYGVKRGAEIFRAGAMAMRLVELAAGGAGRVPKKLIRILEAARRRGQRGLTRRSKTE